MGFLLSFSVERPPRAVFFRRLHACGQGPKRALDQGPHDQAGNDIRHPVRQEDDSRCNNQAAYTQATGANFGDAQETAEATAPTCMAWPEGKAS